MADIYLRSTTGSDGNSGLTNWSNAKATINAALSAAGAGGTVYVSQAHNESFPSGYATVSSPGTFSAPVKILCVNDGAAPPTTTTTGAKVGSTNGWSIGLAGVAYCNGVEFIADRSLLNYAARVEVCSATGAQWVLENCTLTAQNGQFASGISVGGFANLAAQRVAEFRNVTLKTTSVNNALIAYSPLRWTGGAFERTGTGGLTFLSCGGVNEGVSGTVEIVGVDLSTLGAGSSIVDLGSNPYGRVHLRDCRLGAGVALTTGNRTNLAGPLVKMWNCDSADTGNRMQLALVGGNVYSDTAITLPGSSPLSWRMVTNTTPKEHFASLATDNITAWNESVGSSKTLTVEIVHDSATALTDAEVWVEVEYLGTSGVPRGSITTDRRASLLTTPTAQAGSSAAWSGIGGFANPNKQKLEVTFTPQEAGFINARVFLAATNKTIYVNPDFTLV